MNLVAEWKTMSAPRVSGRHSTGEAKVLSIISGIFAAWAIAAMAGMSSTSPPGLPIVSPSTSRVSGLMALAKPSWSRGLTKVVSMPKRGRVSASMLRVPP